MEEYAIEIKVDEDYDRKALEKDVITFFHRHHQWLITEALKKGDPIPEAKYKTIVAEEKGENNDVGND